MESVTDLDPSTISRQPQKDDPQEIRIRQNLESQLAPTDQAKQKFQKAKQLQLDFFRSALTSQNNEQVRQDYLDLLNQLAEVTNTQIEGEENLNLLDGSKGVIVLINHLGTPKLSSFEPTEAGLDLPLDKIEPFPIRHAPLAEISKKTGRPIFETAVTLPTPLDTVQSASGVILVAPSGEGRLGKLINDVGENLQQNHNSLIVMYPEGGTSGKRSDGNPYTLDEFQTGAFVVAEKLGIPILPVCQYFDPKTGYTLGILPSIKVDSQGDREVFHQIAKSTQDSMQTWLNSKH